MHDFPFTHQAKTSVAFRAESWKHDDHTAFNYVSVFSVCCRPKKFTLKNYKRFFFIFKDTHLSMFRDRNETNEAPELRVNIKGQTYRFKAFSQSKRLLRSDVSDLQHVWLLIGVVNNIPFKYYASCVVLLVLSADCCFVHYASCNEVKYGLQSVRYPRSLVPNTHSTDAW